MCDHQHVIQKVILRLLHLLANVTELAITGSLDSAKAIKP